MYVFVGSYERFLFGFEQTGHQLIKKNTYAAHQNAVKCLASGGYFMASGGADDQVHLYDMKHGKDLGFLMNPGDGAVPCIEFYTTPTGVPTHMFSGSADGSIAIWQAGGAWEHLKLMTGHRASVTALTLHPSGRLALSVAHDSTLRMWDLAKGRSNYSAKLDQEADAVAFTPSGDSYVLTCGPKVTLHSVGGEGALLATLPHARRVLCLTQQSEHVLLTGLEDGSINVWDVRTSTPQYTLERAHATRIRAMQPVTQGTGPLPELLATAASDGIVKMWDMRMLGGQGNAGSPAPACVSQVETGARITCMTVVDPRAPGPQLVKSKPTPKPSADEVRTGTSAGSASPVGKAKAGALGKEKVAAGAKAGQKAKGPAPQKGAGVKPARAAPPITFEIVSEEKVAARQQHQANRQAYNSDDEEGAKPAQKPVRARQAKAQPTNGKVSREQAPEQPLAQEPAHSKKQKRQTAKPEANQATENAGQEEVEAPVQPQRPVSSKQRGGEGAGSKVKEQRSQSQQGQQPKMQQQQSKVKQPAHKTEQQGEGQEQQGQGQAGQKKGQGERKVQPGGQAQHRGKGQKRKGPAHAVAGKRAKA